MKRIYIFILLAFLTSSLSFSQATLSKDAQISLMTVGQWSGEVYALFGHTAIRVKDDSIQLDEVYNYGYFDDTKPNFMVKFIQGKTDYVLGVVPYKFFVREYTKKGVEIKEQIINLSDKEKQNLYNSLFINALPENCGYRYNYFFDNCATRPRDMIEKGIHGKIIYPSDDAKKQSLRDLVHESLHSFPWSEFGTDLLLGKGADSIVVLRTKMFLPIYLKNSFEGATVRNDSLSYKLAESSQLIVPQNDKINDLSYHKTFFTPFNVGILVLIISIVISIIQFFGKSKTLLPKVFDTILFATAGTAGLIIFFLMFFSVHPTVQNNWNFAWLNVFALIFAPLFWVKSARKAVNYYHFINFVILISFILFWKLIPQNLPLASIPFSMSLMVRSGVNYFSNRKKTVKNY